MNLQGIKTKIHETGSYRILQILRDLKWDKSVGSTQDAAQKIETCGFETKVKQCAGKNENVVINVKSESVRINVQMPGLTPLSQIPRLSWKCLMQCSRNGWVAEMSA